MVLKTISNPYEKMDLEKFIHLTQEEGLYGFSIGDDKESIYPDHAGILFNDKNDIISVYKTDRHNRYHEVARCVTEEIALVTLLQILRRKKVQQRAA